MRNRRFSRKTKLLATLVIVGVTASVAGLGTFATFTSSTSASQSISTGTVTIALGAAGPANRLTVNATAVAPGDTMQRAFNLANTGTIDLAAAPTLTTTASPSSLLDTDTTDGLQMTLDRCDVPWTESGSAPAYTYTCSGTTSAVLASRPVIGAALALSNLSDLATAGTTAHLRLTLSLPTPAGNTFQGLSSTLTYTFTGTQRAGTSR